MQQTRRKVKHVACINTHTHANTNPQIITVPGSGSKSRFALQVCFVMTATRFHLGPNEYESICKRMREGGVREGGMDGFVGRETA